MGIQKPREIAVRALRRRENSAKYIEEILGEELNRSGLAGVDRRLAHELTYGAVRWEATLDWLIDRKTEQRVAKALLRILLRIGLYQIFWLERIPDHAAVHESVELAKRFGLARQSGFVNALLRGYLREADQTRQLLDDLKTRQPSLGYSHPEWLWDRWQRHWGTGPATQLLIWNNQPPKIFARVNTLRTDAEKLLALWRDEGVDYNAFHRDWTGENIMFELKSARALDQLSSFQQGFFYVQDPSTLLAVQELDPQSGESVLDTCAAPGGKTTFIAQQMRDHGRIVARDLSQERLNLLRENCHRLGVRSVEFAPVLNSRPPDESAPGSHTAVSRDSPRAYDRILVDAPCSNTGVMRRRVELRWRIDPNEIERLGKVQHELLAQAADALKSGGVLIYSTCSLEPEENQSVVEQFLNEHREFRLERERELLPFRDQVDGAYVARLMKTRASAGT